VRALKAGASATASLSCFAVKRDGFFVRWLVGPMILDVGSGAD
jgi:hypothetical protein